MNEKIIECYQVGIKDNRIHLVLNQAEITKGLILNKDTFLRWLIDKKRINKEIRIEEVE